MKKKNIYVNQSQELIILFEEAGNGAKVMCVPISVSKTGFDPNGGVLPKKGQSFLLTFSWCSSHFPISTLGHLRSPLNREVFEIVHYYCDFTQSRQPNLTQI